MATRNKQVQKIIITLDQEGSCQILSPPEVQLDEVMDILTAALDAAYTKSEEEQAYRKEIRATLDSFESKAQYKN